MFSIINIYILNISYFRSYHQILGIFCNVKTINISKLCGASNTITICKLLFTNDQQLQNNNVKIGRGWTKFCFYNNSHPTDNLEFLCDSIMAAKIF